MNKSTEQSNPSAKFSNSRWANSSLLKKQISLNPFSQIHHWLNTAIITRVTPFNRSRSSQFEIMFRLYGTRLFCISTISRLSFAIPFEFCHLIWTTHPVVCTAVVLVNILFSCLHFIDILFIVFPSTQLTVLFFKTIITQPVEYTKIYSIVYCTSFRSFYPFTRKKMQHVCFLWWYRCWSSNNFQISKKKNVNVTDHNFVAPLIL